MTDDDFADLPALAQDYTYDQAMRVVKYLAPLPLSDLRQRQSIHSEQIQMAVAQGKGDVVLSEQVRLDLTTAAVSLQTFGEVQWSSLLPAPEVTE